MSEHQFCQLCDQPMFIKCNVKVIDTERQFTMKLCEKCYHEAGRVLPLSELERLV